ncbi:MAG: hypothetical protein V1886_01855 [archaeon]
MKKDIFDNKKLLLHKLNKFALDNNISDNVGGPVKNIEGILNDVHMQINRAHNKKRECIIYLHQKKDGGYYHVIYGKL